MKFRLVVTICTLLAACGDLGVEDAPLLIDDAPKSALLVERRQASLPYGVDVGGLSTEERAVFWKAAAHLNELAGRPLFLPDSPHVHVTVSSGERDCELGDVTGWFSSDTHEVCIDFPWLLTGGGWAADRLIAHELLHSLGLGHDLDDPASLMSPNLTVRGASELRPQHVERIMELTVTTKVRMRYPS